MIFSSWSWEISLSVQRDKKKYLIFFFFILSLITFLFIALFFYFGYVGKCIVRFRLSQFRSTKRRESQQPNKQSLYPRWSARPQLIVVEQNYIRFCSSSILSIYLSLCLIPCCFTFIFISLFFFPASASNSICVCVCMFFFFSPSFTSPLS